VITIVAVVASGCAPGDDTSPASPATLHPDGIGPYRIGDPAATVIDGVSSRIGGWDGDSSAGDGSLEPAQCGSEAFRQVSWGNLVLFFEIAGEGTFTAWAYGFDPILGNSDNERGLALTTEEGIGLGSTRMSLESAYGARVQIEDDTAIDLATFAIDGTDPAHIVGSLDAAESLDAEVLSLESAPGCDQPLE
jgi:hypothetical protein